MASQKDALRFPHPCVIAIGGGGIKKGLGSVRGSASRPVDGISNDAEIRSDGPLKTLSIEADSPAVLSIIWHNIQEEATQTHTTRQDLI